MSEQDRQWNVAQPGAGRPWGAAGSQTQAARVSSAFSEAASPGHEAL